MVENENIQIAEDRKFILNEDGWPYWPVLPVKRSQPDGGWPECGTICAGTPSTVFLVPMYELKVDSPKKTYADLNELLDDGWEVD